MHPTRSVFPLLILAAFFLTCTNGRPSVRSSVSKDGDPRWVAVDSLSDIGQYASALELTQAILFDAQAKNDWRTEFRAWMNKGRFETLTGADRQEALAAIEERANNSDVPLRQLLRSALGEAYWNYYRSERWQVLERTETAGDNADPETWTQGQFMARIIAEYGASLEPYDTLKRIPVGDLGELLTDERSAQPLRSTLFDLLAHRALDVFTNAETRITEPAWRFKLDDVRAFDLFEPFVFRKLTHRDSTAWEFQALRLYQQLERLHLNEEPIDALVDATLGRLEFVREHSTLARKDSLYLGALEMLRSRLPGDSCWSEVTVAMARWHAEHGIKYDRLAGDAWKWEKRTALWQCDSAIARWPGSFGARNALALKARLERPEFDVQCEEAVPPNTPFPAALRYTNLKQVWVRIVKDKPLEDPKNRVARWFSPEPDREEQLLGRKPTFEWSVDLPDDGDLNLHMVEIPVAALPFGHYTIIVSGSPTFSKGVDQLVYAGFWVTRMALADRSQGTELDLLVVDRVSGALLQGVKAWSYVRNYDYTGIDRFVGVEQFSTDAEGMVRTTIKGAQGQIIWSLSNGDDEYISGQRWVYTNGGADVPDSLRTFLFTDRAIYRPGQEVLFKGIVTVKRGKGSVTQAAYMTTVRFFDVNGQLVDSVNVATDAFGSFNGRFKAPQGALTGGMRIEEAHGSQYFQVEEYKRPTFELVFDPITATPKLEQEATVTGFAKSYAGAPLDGAQVKWTVKRGARMPWWCGWGWRGLPWGRETEIASGDATCDAQGKFTVRFVAQSDRSFPRGADPTFFYTVEAAATDINGETQQATTSLNIGYRGIDIVINTGDAIDRAHTDTLDLHLKNLNGQEVDLPMEVLVVGLTPPADAPHRDPLWERPDRTLDGSVVADPDPLHWTDGTAYLLRSEHRAKGGALKLTGITDWPVGMYRIDVKAQDADGVMVKASRVITVYDTAIQNTGFVNEAFHVEPIKVSCEPGEKAVLLLSSALPEGRVLMEVERDGMIVVARRFTLRKGQQRVELPVMESDRGGFAIHFLCVERGRVHNTTQWIDVPWSNKDLQVEWTSFRDKLLPGQKEEWRLRISGPKKEKVAAQLLGVLYDASLDHFVPHSWNLNIWEQNPVQRSWSRTEPFGAAGAQRIYVPETMPADTVRSYPQLKYGGVAVYTVMLNSLAGVTNSWAGDGERSNRDRAETTTLGFFDRSSDEAGKKGEDDKPPADPASTTGRPATDNGPPALRSDFRETAFFFPDLLTDRDGSVVLRFTMPDALTRWKFMGLAHTKDLQLASLTKETVTQKPMMVVPNLPRFLRQGDRITLTAKVNVIEGGTVNGTAALELYDPFTNKAVTGLFGMSKSTRTFSAAPGQSAIVSWALIVPEDLDAVALRITASAPGISDGEERVLPILTDKVLVTESLPIAITKAGTKTFTLEKLKNTTSTTLRHQSLKLEFTPNPAWYAVQALPYLMEFPHECAEQTFSRYYANRLASHIVEERPKIKQVFEAWSKAGPESFMSALEKNTELKGIVLEETPWVLNAKDEGERKRRVALFFDMQRMAKEEAASLKKLQEMQLSTGAWPWWSGMAPSRYITQHIVTGLGHLEKLGALDPEGDAQEMLHNAVQWLDKQVEEDHRRMLREFKGDTLPMPSPEDFHFLYARSFFPQWSLDKGKNSAVEFILDRGRTGWMQYRSQEQVMIAIALHRMGDERTASLIMESLKQRATVNEELGMYWKDFNAGSYWYEFPTETHALMIEAFNEVTKDKASVDLLRQYLLKLKQTTDWKTTKATADACYALLLTGDDWLDPKTPPMIMVGGERVNTDRQEAGTGYFEQSWTADQVKPAMGQVSVSTSSDGVQWGALHWQYFERMDKVTPHESPFSIRKQVMLHEQTDAGARLVALDQARGLKPGDKLTIRIELRTDRYVDFVHLKDQRAAGLEPVEALSGYKWQGGLGYYQSIRDAGMHFFFDRIAPGT
ncbi:MAG: alpha-2-macroglobulin family protein, partial [Flavobacteriales bacterium]